MENEDLYLMLFVSILVLGMVGIRLLDNNKPVYRADGVLQTAHQYVMTPLSGVKK